MDRPLPSLFVADKKIVIIPLKWKQEDGKLVEHRQAPLLQAEKLEILKEPHWKPEIDSV